MMASVIEARDAYTGGHLRKHCQHRVHRDGDTVVAEPTGAKGTAEDLKPRPETGSIDAFVNGAPQWVDI